MLKAIALAALAGLVVLAAGCQPTVQVRTGTRTVCTYGEVVEESITTVEVPAALADQYGVQTKTITCEKHAGAEALYSAAQDAIRAGDLKAARDALERLIAADANFGLASAQLKEIVAGRTPKPDRSRRGGASGPATGTAGVNDPLPVGPIANLSSWLPDTLPGFSSQPLKADTVALTREYLPAGAGHVGQIVVFVEQYKTPAAATAAMATGVKRSYATSPATLQVKGRSIYFGTDGKRFAIIAWNEGGVVVTVEAMATSGPATALKDDLTAVANALIK